MLCMDAWFPFSSVVPLRTTITLGPMTFWLKAGGSHLPAVARHLPRGRWGMEVAPYDWQQIWQQAGGAATVRGRGLAVWAQTAANGASCTRTQRVCIQATTLVLLVILAFILGLCGRYLRGARTAERAGSLAAQEGHLRSGPLHEGFAVRT